MELCAFDGCAGISGENFILPDEIKYIGYWAFNNCGWDKVIIPPGTAVIENNAFDPSLTSMFAVDPGNPFFYTEDGALFRSEEQELLLYNGGAGNAEYSVPEGTLGLASGTFLGCKSLQTVYIPASVTSISSGTFGWKSYSRDLIIYPLIIIEKGSYAREYLKEYNYDNWKYADENSWLEE